MYSLLIIGGACCLFILIAGGPLAGFIYVFSRISSLFSATSKALAEDNRVYFDRVVPELLRWHSGTLEDISSRIEHSGRSGFGKLHDRGTIQSLRQPEKAWMAYDMELTWGKGQLELYTNRYVLELEFGGIGSHSTPVSVDGAPFGIIISSRQIQLLDYQERPWGIYHRHQLWINVEPPKQNLNSYYGLVELDGKTLGELNRNPLLTHRVFGETVFPPLFQNLADNLDENQEIWLIALVGWELRNRIIVRLSKN